jgi:uncharacterized membrane protein YedE/YeeE
MAILYLALGTIFGFALSRSGAADYDYIQGMFLFQRFQLYGILATGVLFTAPGLWLIKRRGRTIGGKPIHIELNIGEGKVYAIAALAGALAGAALFGTSYERLQNLFGLPPLKKPQKAAA